MVDPDDPALDSLLDYLKRTRGFDFTGYKRASLARRVDRRLTDIGVELSYYEDYLEVQPDEVVALLNTILINVTSFFRDAAVWRYLAADAIPALLKGKDPDEPIRVWSAGCSSGEEAYSLAILLVEALGEKEFRRRVKIFATDIDEDALAIARAGAYSSKAVEPIEASLRAKYFEPAGEDRVVFRPDLRRTLIFGIHDLVRHAPISRIDLIACRNVLMYLNLETQERVLDHLRFALQDDGILVLGKAELMMRHPGMFVLVDLRQRVFRKNPNEPAAGAGRAARPAVVAPDAPPEWSAVWSSVFEAGAAAIVLGADLQTLGINRMARELFGLTTSDVGRPFQDLDVSYTPIELRSQIERAYVIAAPVWLHDVEVVRGGQHLVFEVGIEPMLDADGGAAGCTIVFSDRTRERALSNELERARQELETSNEELQSAHEELETSNEELQSTVEELETTNEELQASNEELETVNEELQSTNAEVQAVNDELARRTEEATLASAYLQSILTSIRSAVVVLDRALSVQMWSRAAEEFWGMREHETAGRAFFDLEIGLPVDDLRNSIQSCIEGAIDERISLSAVDRRGRRFECFITVSPLTDLDGDVSGVVLVMEVPQPGSR